LEDFEEIGHSGGKIELKKEKDNSIMFKISGANPWAMSMHFIAISIDGKILGIIKNIGGYAPDSKPEVQNYIQGIVISDRNGLYGRTCPTCKGYFRTDSPADPTYCPYCYYEGNGINFLTKNQLQFIDAYFKTYINILVNGGEAVIDLDEITNKLENNKSPWVYSEEKQQTQIRCECDTVFDILGEYGRCTQCCKHNSTKIINDKFEITEKDFVEYESNTKESNKRENEWKSILSNGVSIYDGLGNEFRRRLLYLPYTPKRRNDLAQISFQNILKSGECLNNWFAIDVFSGIKEDDKSFINKMFNKRHLFSHKNGIVDNEYLNNTSDTSLKLGQLVRLKSKEIKRFIPLIRHVCINLITGFESIK